jgi:colicin import membrane protein
MRGPSLQKTALLSFGLHLIVFFVAVLIFRQSSHFIMPSPYMVNLVNPDVPHQMNRREVSVPRQQKQEPAPASEIPRKHTREITKDRDMAKEMEMAEKKIAAIVTKRKIEEIEKTFKQRSVISLNTRGDNKTIKPAVSKPGNTSAQSVAPVSQGKIFDDYYAKIIKEIWAQWRWNPDLGRKDIEAVVSIKILRDGTAIVQRIEKSSGNTLFDRSALRALTLASPLSPPPHEIELGVRFFP